MENETVMRVHPVSDSFEAEDLTNIVLKFTAVCDVSADSSSFFVDRNGAKIGRENTNEIHVPSDTSLAPVSHSILEYSCGKFYLSDCGHNFAASVRIGEGGQRKSWVVQEGTQFSAGTSVFRCAGKSPTGELILMIIEGPLKGQQRNVCGRTSCTIGRSLDNDICVPDRELSRRHSKVEFNPDTDQYILSDCSSSNGTYVQLVGPNGGRLRINLNDHILVGRTGFSINRYDFGVSEEIGHRKTMEDSCTIKQHLNIVPLCVRGFSPQSFFGVFDGHGGTEASHYLSQNLHINVTDGLLAVSEELLTELTRARSGRRSALEVGEKKEFDGLKGRYLPSSPLGVSTFDQELPHDDSLPGSPLSLTPPPPNRSHSAADEDSLDSIVIKSLKQSFIKTDDDFIRTSEHPQHGSTATTAIVLGGRLYCANVGDSRTLLCRNFKLVSMTQDHKPSREDEARRIIKAGGCILNNRVLGELAVSRAFGDSGYKKTRLEESLIEPEVAPEPSQSPLSKSHNSKIVGPLLIAEPDIQVTTVGETDQFLLVACDGLFDVFTGEEIVTFVTNDMREHGDAQKCCQNLTHEAIQKRHSRDNVSVILIILNKWY